jgi:teichoic acid ribitol-phosphate primase
VPGQRSLPYHRPLMSSRRTLTARFGAAIVRIGFAAGRILPLRRRVVLATQRSSTLSGNLLYLRRELDRRRDIPVTVLAYRTTAGVAGRIATTAHALRAGFLLATSRVFIVDDWFFPMDAVTPRRGTYRVQTWHAAGAFKKFGYSSLDRSWGPDEELIRTVRIHGNYDLCLVSSRSAAVHYAEAFRLPLERFTSALGLPRTDLFFDPQHRAAATEAITRRYRLPPGRKILLYAPTFRGDSVRAARYQADLDLATLRAALDPEWLLLLRLHPFVRGALRPGPELADFVVDVSDWPDANELMFVADLLVTDYSSVIFEFALLARPMAFFAPDYDDYERDRGLYFDYRSGVPGPVFETTEALAAHVRAGQFDLERVHAFARASFDVADGMASRRVVDRVVIPALDGETVSVETAPPAGAIR